MPKTVVRKRDTKTIDIRYNVRNIALVFPANAYFITRNRNTCQRSQFRCSEKSARVFLSMIHFVERSMRQFLARSRARCDLMNVTGSYRLGNETLERQKSCWNAWHTLRLHKHDQFGWKTWFLLLLFSSLLSSSLIPGLNSDKFTFPCFQFLQRRIRRLEKQYCSIEILVVNNNDAENHWLQHLRDFPLKIS